MHEKHPAIVCRCMDITLEEMTETFRIMKELLGIVDIDIYRKMSSATTGYCQGRACLQHLQRIFYSEVRKLGLDPSKINLLPRRRPPLQPTPIGVFAKMSAEGDEK